MCFLATIEDAILVQVLQDVGARLPAFPGQVMHLRTVGNLPRLQTLDPVHALAAQIFDALVERTLYVLGALLGQQAWQLRAAFAARLLPLEFKKLYCIELLGVHHITHSTITSKADMIAQPMRIALSSRSITAVPPAL